MTDTLTAPTTAPPTDGDHDVFTHIVKGTADSVTWAIIEGMTMEALCGKLWVPHRNPEGYDICPTCEAEYEKITGKKWGT